MSSDTVFGSAQMGAGAGLGPNVPGADPFGSVAIISSRATPSQSLAKYLGGSGYPTRVVTSLHDVDSILGGVSSDVIVLDLPLFGHDSLEEIARLSRIGSHYLIVFGDDANGIDGISALEAGADYF